MALPGKGSVTGTHVERPRRYVIDDPLGAGATLSTANESVITLADGSRLTEPAGNDRMSFSDGSLVIPLYNPTTGDLIAGQTTTVAAVYRGIYSVWRYIVTQRGG